MNERFVRGRSAWVDDHLEAWLDGELSSADAERMERLLAASPGLERQAALARRIRDELQATPDYRCPPAVSRSVFRTVRRGRRFGLRDWLPAPGAPAWGLAGAAATLLLALGLWIVMPEFSEQPQPAVYTVDGETISAEELAEAQQQLQLAMAYVDQISDQINREVGQYVVGNGMLAPVSKGLNQGAANAKQSLKKVYRESSS